LPWWKQERHDSVDWHNAVCALEASGWDRRIDEAVAALRNSSANVAARREREAQLAMEGARRKDELIGFHRRQREREKQAAQVHHPLLQFFFSLDFG